MLEVLAHSGFFEASIELLSPRRDESNDHTGLYGDYVCIDMAVCIHLSIRIQRPSGNLEQRLLPPSVIAPSMSLTPSVRPCIHSRTSKPLSDQHRL